jgi:hypothetical protein
MLTTEHTSNGQDRWVKDLVKEIGYSQFDVMTRL